MERSPEVLPTWRTLRLKNLKSARAVTSTPLGFGSPVVLGEASLHRFAGSQCKMTANPEEYRGHRDRSDALSPLRGYGP